MEIKEELERGRLCLFIWQTGNQQTLKAMIQNVVIKNLKGESAKSKRRFKKEAGILNHVSKTTETSPEDFDKSPLPS